jgi:hypothetical protein
MSHDTIRETLRAFQQAYVTAHPSMPDISVVKDLVNKLGRDVYDLPEADENFPPTPPAPTQEPQEPAQEPVSPETPRLA